MKKVFAILAAFSLCFGAFAQESKILEDWDDQIESREDDFLSSFAYTNFTYNNFLAAPEGVNQHGWGINFSILHIGFNPWKYGRFTLGLFDMSFDFGYLKPGYHYINLDKNISFNNVLVPDGNKSGIVNFAYTFPVGYIQKFGESKWSAAILVSPGVGWDRYHNQWVSNNVRHEENLRLDRGGNYFRLDVKAMIWYDYVGFVARYSFPKGFQGPGIVSAGISLRI
jgi:hypothetical protein